MFMRNHCSWNYDYHQTPQKHFKTSDERKQGHIKIETWFCYYCFNPEVRAWSAHVSIPGRVLTKEGSDPRGAEGWLELTPLVQPLNPCHSPSQSIKVSFQIKKERVIFGYKDMFASKHKAVKFGQCWCTFLGARHGAAGERRSPCSLRPPPATAPRHSSSPCAKTQFSAAAVQGSIRWQPGSKGNNVLLLFLTESGIKLVFEIVVRKQ